MVQKDPAGSPAAKRNTAAVASTKTTASAAGSRSGQLDVPGAVTATAGVALPGLAGDTLQATQPALLGGLAALLLAAFVVRRAEPRRRCWTWPCSKTAASPGPISP